MPADGAGALRPDPTPSARSYVKAEVEAMPRPRRRLASLASIVVLLAALAAAPERAALAASTLTVTTTADLAPPCGAALSLRCALARANRDGSGDTIAFNVPATDA